jgi:hypothetical protein
VKGHEPQSERGGIIFSVDSPIPVALRRSASSTIHNLPSCFHGEVAELLQMEVSPGSSLLLQLCPVLDLALVCATVISFVISR